MGEGKVEYWKKRMLDKVDSFMKGYNFHFDELLRWGVHSKLQSKDIKNQILKIEEGVRDLKTAIIEAKEKVK